MDTDYIPLAGQIFTGAFTLIDLIFVIILLLLLLCSALISGSEVAYFSLSPSQLKYLEDNGYEKARNLQQKPNRLLATILISNNFVNVAIVVLSTYLVNSLFDFSAYPTLGFIIQVIVVTFVILLAGEIIPKLYANRSQLSMVIFMAGPLTFLSHLFRPLSALLIGSTSIISKRMDKKDNLSIDQLSKALELTKDTAINEEKDILEGIVRFGNIDAVDIIRPRINVIAIDGSSSYQQVKEIITEHGYSRMPVYEENLDNITGILYVKDLLQHLDEKEDFRWQTLIRPAYFVPETKKINDLLEEFQTKKVHLAIVVDEYGGTTGIVTMEDIIEEIVGDINDEYDEQEIVYTRDKNGSYIFEASTLLNDFYKITDIEEDSFQEVEGDADTLAGLILEIKGELPHKDEVITYKEHQFKVLEVDNRRIKKIQYKKTGQLPLSPITAPKIS
ncbi:MAG TPA: gliding motility-associated protein GldE [Butyricimonas virosa]|uniref:Gliding motility-associated protein GldE n=1 Tax=Butyricimonas virosa TaxID=544645 RepID=A0A921KZP8_9BACT|nr:gliding motility-associated protein GldE [Butyricimonas virosa]